MLTELDEAICIAVQAHAGQMDKAGEPYILHPLQVMLKFSDPKLRIIAVLHDVVEDSDWELADLAPFGTEVCEALDALTRRKDEVYADYINRCGANPLARRVKLADLMDNTSPQRIAALSPNQSERYFEALYTLTPSPSQENTNG